MSQSSKPTTNKRKPGHKANYRGATPEQVARAFYWNRRRKSKPACHSDRVAEDGPLVKASL